VILVWLAIAFLLAICASLLIAPLVIGSANALKLYDSPDGARRVHDVAVPRLGGIAVFLTAAAVGIMVLILAEHLFLPPGDSRASEVRFLLGIFLGSALLFLVGLVDDVIDLSPAVKSAAQVIAALVAYYFGARLDNIALGYGVGVPTGIFELPLLILWIVGVTNAYNFIDGLNGLAGGIAIVASATIVIVALALGNLTVLVPAVALAGALFGFLHFNFPKARLFLGDSGSMSVGFLLAVMSLHASINRSDAVLVIVPLLAVFVPLMDGALAIVRRWLRRVPLSGADARHIHHRLLALGLTHQRTAEVLWVVAACMSGFGLLIALTAPFVATSIALFGLVGVAVLLIYGTNLLSYHELIVAGEVLMSGPSRARRVITDQIIALDLASMMDQASSVDEVASLLSAAANKFGFLAIELGGEAFAGRSPLHDRLIAKSWAWKLEYPIRVTANGNDAAYTLIIWCSQETNHRPYGAERVARTLGPALAHWFEAQELDGDEKIARIAARKSPIFQRKVRIIR
jgi:UDP-GlcNAc:undecaprenyl-phosphate GlcNAc-1-phosphate transferase